ncbi:MAG TPA: RNA polymerase subunit sigma-70 [Lachnospiraceae bacterium]|nr:RNA polymerase subunit sigma-70 [Lachnospiraceae bacterium]
MEKSILEQYVDACELISETERDIQRLEDKQHIVQDSVRGSMHEFPYAAQSFHLEGISSSSVGDRIALEISRKLLQERKEGAEKLKHQVEAWMLTIPTRMQRIIRLRFFEGESWAEVARIVGRTATEESVKKEFYRFLQKN